MSLAGESSSASASDRGSLAAGVRGLSGAITMERSEHEKLKYPDRINLDRKGLHGNTMMIGWLVALKVRKFARATQNTNNAVKL